MVGFLPCQDQACKLVWFLHWHQQWTVFSVLWYFFIF